MYLFVFQFPANSGRRSCFQLTTPSICRYNLGTRAGRPGRLMARAGTGGSGRRTERSGQGGECKGVRLTQRNETLKATEALRAVRAHAEQPDAEVPMSVLKSMS
jgi:hypothetical protein